MLLRQFYGLPYSQSAETILVELDPPPTIRLSHNPRCSNSFRWCVMREANQLVDGRDKPDQGGLWLYSCRPKQPLSQPDKPGYDDNVNHMFVSER
jgi:hypothetical protein